MAAEEVTQTSSRQLLTISVFSVFSVKWLKPKLNRFYEMFPDVTVAVDESDDLATFRNDGIDEAVRWGDGKFDNLESNLLIRLQSYTAVSPVYIAKHGKIDDLSNPSKHLLIEFHYGLKALRYQHNLGENRIAGDIADFQSRLIILPDGHQSLIAALSGQWVALLSSYFVEDGINSGDLEYMCDHPGT